MPAANINTAIFVLLNSCAETLQANPSATQRLMRQLAPESADARQDAGVGVFCFASVSPLRDFEGFIGDRILGRTWWVRGDPPDMSVRTKRPEGRFSSIVPE